MDRRSWLWRRKSSQKSPNETDSCGSISERFFHDQVYPVQNPQSPEITSKASSVDDEIDEGVKTLKQKLSAALLDISVKDDLVKQHAKVADEAVTGWEKAEKELFSLKQRHEAATTKNCVLEDRVGHLDAALKECMRQLRQVREEHEQRTNAALARKTSEWDSVKSELENKINELQAQLQTAESKASASVDSDLFQNPAALEMVNSSLKNQILAQAEEIEIRIMERDLSNQTAETASKQYLESTKKVAKLDAECRRLKLIADKFHPVDDHKSTATSSILVESLTDSPSDNGDRLLESDSDALKIKGSDMHKCQLSYSDSKSSSLFSGLKQPPKKRTSGRNFMIFSAEIDLMDDFLEMERVAALTDSESGSSYLSGGPSFEQTNESDSPWKAEHGAMMRRTAELEERLEKLEQEKVEIQKSLKECQSQLQISRSRLKEADVQLLEQKAQLALAKEVIGRREDELASIKSMREAAESKLLVVESENKSLLSQVGLLGAEVEKERASSAEALTKSRKLEDELSELKCESKIQHEAELKHEGSFKEELKIMQDKELAVAASKFAECHKTILSLGRQLKSLATMEDFLADSENVLVRSH